MSAEPKTWAARLLPYAQVDDRRSLFELALSVLAYGVFSVASFAALSAQPLWLVITVPLASVFLVRVFIMQHDCGHGALLSARAANDWIGRALGILTFTPYDVWRHAHALHHASHGNLDKRGFGDIDTLTVGEYEARDAVGRLKYRLYRHPLVLFVLGPAYMFLLQHRLPVGYSTKGGAFWISSQVTNLGILGIAALIVWQWGWAALFLVHLPIVVLAAAIGVWLFYVQHQFDPTFWARAPQWQREHAALHGSSFYDLPKPLMWLTGNIGIHHVHHLSSRIPFYRLPDILDAFPEFRETGRLTLRGSLGCMRLTLWDEADKRMISFRDFSALRGA